MFIKQSFDTFIRIYDGLGYITNKAVFSDRVCNESGAVFLSVISRTPQKLEDILNKAVQKFDSVTVDEIKDFALEFYKILEEDKYIVTGETIEELEAKDKENRFSYKKLAPKTIVEDFTPDKERAENTTQNYLENHFSDKPHLVSFQMELTSRCNERCVHCYIPHEYKNTDITDEMFYSVLEQCKDLGVLTLTLSGGEPMAHPHFAEYLKKAKEYDFSVSILSNLTLMTDDILAVMKEIRLSSVQVSLYSMDPLIHDNITKVKGSWEKTINSINRLVENDIPLQLSCPVMRENKDSIVDVYKYGAKLKVKVVSDYNIMAHYDHTTGNLVHRLSVEETGEVVKTLLEYDEKKQQALLSEIDYFNTPEEKRPRFWDDEQRVCGICQSSICMVSNGNIYPCAGWQSYICGNLNEQSLEDIWLNSPKTNYIRSIRQKDFPKCKNCSSERYCNLCMVRNANEDPDGNPLTLHQYFCDVAKKTKEITENWVAEHK